MKQLLALLLLAASLAAFTPTFTNSTEWNHLNCPPSELQIECLTVGDANRGAFDTCLPLKNNSDFYFLANNSGAFGGIWRWCKLANATGFLPSGYIDITTVPAGASIYISRDRQALYNFEGTTPLSNYLYFEGFHDLKISKLGFADYYQFVKVTPGNITYVRVTLTPSATPFPSVYPYIPKPSENTSTISSPSVSILPSQPPAYASLPNATKLPYPSDAIEATQEPVSLLDESLHFAVVTAISVLVVVSGRYAYSRFSKQKPKTE